MDRIELNGDGDIPALLVKVKKQVAIGKQIVLETKLSINAFQHRVGIESAKTAWISDVLREEIKAENDPLIYETIGKMVLDYYIPSDYFIKSVADQTVYEIKGEGYSESQTN